MVLDESNVLPSPAAFDSNETDDPISIGVDETLSQSRPSRPSQDQGWLDEDHYFEHDLPSEEFNPGEWKEEYKHMDEIQVNGALRRQWKFGRKEITQIRARCSVVLGKESLRREDFVEWFYRVDSPLFDLFWRRLKWDHPTFLKFFGKPALICQSMDNSQAIRC